MSHEKVIECIRELAENVGEEMHDSKKYAWAALHKRDEDSELAEHYLSMSAQELGHAEQNWRQMRRKMETLKEEHPEQYATMQGLYDWVTDMYEERAAKVMHLHEMYRK